jgi:shikimate 5-dehydrogenase
MDINKDTLVFGSFSKKAGNVGCKIFNNAFKLHKINAIYKSFSVDNIEKAIQSAKFLNFSGFGISMPYKTEVIKYIDILDDNVIKTQSCNTIVNKNNILYGYNTDYIAVREFLIEFEYNKEKFFFILGNGSYSKTVQICCKELDIKYKIITRDNWDAIKNIKNSTIFNCTPVTDIKFDKETNRFIDCINTTKTGYILAKKQAAIQYKIYTQLEFTDYE